MKSYFTATLLCVSLSGTAFADTVPVATNGTTTVAAGGGTATGTATTPAAAPVETAKMSITAVLNAGYEIRSSLVLSDESQKQIWPNDPVSAYSILILQKGTSIATCYMATSGLLMLPPETLDYPTSCHVR